MRPIRCQVLIATVIAAVWLAGICVPSANAGKPPASPIQVTLTPNAWTTVPLPAMPLGIAEHDGVLWACGADEMLARSDDGGRTWTVVHRKPHGAQLAALAFAKMNGWAVGTHGVGFYTLNGGAAWKEMAPTPGLMLKLMAADSTHLFAAGMDNFYDSSDGGKQWHAHAIPGPALASGIPNYHQVEDIAMVDANHFAALLSGVMEPSNRKGQRFKTDAQMIVATSDGGRIWHMAHISPALQLEGLRGDAGRYDAWGFEKTGETWKLVTIHSAAGAHWSVAPQGFSAEQCIRAGCLLTCHCGWVDLKGASPINWKTAVPLPLTTQWAAEGNVLCVVGQGLQCTLAKQDGPVPASAAATAGTMPGEVAPPVQLGTLVTNQCLRCLPPVYPAMARRMRMQGRVILHALIGANGHIQTLGLEAADSSYLVDAAMDAARGWRYSPSFWNGVPVSVDAVIVIQFHLGDADWR